MKETESHCFFGGRKKKSLQSRIYQQSKIKPPINQRITANTLPEGRRKARRNYLRKDERIGRQAKEPRRNYHKERIVKIRFPPPSLRTVIFMNPKTSPNMAEIRLRSPRFIFVIITGVWRHFYFPLPLYFVSLPIISIIPSRISLYQFLSQSMTRRQIYLRTEKANGKQPTHIYI